MEYKLRAKIEQNEEEIKTWGDFEPIAAGWMFPTLKAKRYEPSVQPITRITNQLNDLNRVIWKELGLGIRTPDGVWDWIGRKRGELESLGSELANREVFGYFRGANIVKNHMLNNIIVQHCLSVDFINKVGEVSQRFSRMNLPYC